ncbi:MAG TPA: hypothetical protein PLP42_11145 [Acidobacteriota bacterium]|nr:hypothetical protein [Acidobacteriota bacterium]
MSDKLKSAWEIALEKLNAQEAAPVEKLSEDQKAAIAEIRKRFKAKIAEAEIGAESRIKRAVQTGAFDQIEQIRQELVQERNRLNREMEAEVEKVRSG